MEIAFAPLEGITDSTYRRLHQKYFGGISRYYTPFIAPGATRRLSAREEKSVCPGEQGSVPLIPQILTARAEDFLWAVRHLESLGYEEVNLNCGCPSGTVTAKGKGAGMLRDTEALKRFLDDVFTVTDIRISVKTRIGWEDTAELARILAVFNGYPLTELIVHPRTCRELYRGAPHLEAFAYATEHSANPLCYNGDIRSIEDFERLRARFPSVERVMIGRGLVAAPYLAEELLGATPDRSRLFDFAEELAEAYKEEYGSARSALPRLKEIWGYMIRQLPDGEAHVRKLSKIRDAVEFQDYIGNLRYNR